MKIEENLKTDEFVSKHELMDLTNMSERAVRQQISNLKLKRPVIYSSRQKGYRLAKSIADLSTLEEVEAEYNAIQNCIADIQARKKVFDKQLRTYIAYLKSIEKVFMQDVSDSKL